jgi:hypothetical protein
LSLHNVGGLDVQFTVSTSPPGSNMPFPLESWNSVIVSDVNAMSMRVSVQFEFGQSGAPAIGDQERARHHHDHDERAGHVTRGYRG